MPYMIAVSLEMSDEPYFLHNRYFLMLLINFILFTLQITVEN